MSVRLTFESARSKRPSDDVPTRERMNGKGLRRRPDADQKKVRRQMLRTEQDQRRTAAVSTEESTTMSESFQQREAALLRRMASSNDLAEQRRLSEELERSRAERTAALAEERSLDLANTIIRDTFTPVAVHERHTAATDWVLEQQTGGYDASAADHTMRTKATLWFQNLHEAVKEDAEEFTEQARGIARREAGAYGEDAVIVAQAFLDTAERLRTQAGYRKIAETASSTCKHCGRSIEFKDGRWIDPEATGDDSVWAETCDSHDTFTAEHEPEEKTASRTAADMPHSTPAGGQNGQGESTVTDYDAAPPDDSTFDETFWEGDETGGARGVHPSYPGAGEVAKAGSKTAIHLTNVGIEGPGVGSGTSSDGTRITFMLSPKDEADLKAVLYSDLAMNFSGVDIEPSDVISEQGGGNSMTGDNSRGASKTAAEDLPWKAQMAGVNEMVWSGNGLTFATQEEAKAYALDLLGRWFGADLARVVPSDTPTREPVDLNDPQIVVNYRTAARRTAAESQTCPNCGSTKIETDDKGGKLCEKCGERLSAGDRTSSRTAAEGQTCSVCGDAIAKDPGNEDNSTWHHDNGEKHDHEAKPASSNSKESRKTAAATSHCLECGGETYWNGSRWLHSDSDKDHSVEVPTQDQGGPKESSLQRTAARPIYEIAAEIKKEWGQNVNYAAKPYLDAMLHMDSINDKFGEDEGKWVVAYFLNNAASFRGEKAKALKDELRAIQKGASKTAAEYQGGSPKAGDTAICHADDLPIEFFDGAWYHYSGGPSHNDVHPATPKERAEKNAHVSPYTGHDFACETYRTLDASDCTCGGESISDLDQPLPEATAGLDMWGSLNTDAPTAQSGPTRTSGLIGLSAQGALQRLADDSGNGQNGNADSSLPDEPEGDTSKVMWPVELTDGDPKTGEGAADVASVPTPGGESGYPKTSSLTPEQAAFRARVQANLR